MDARGPIALPGVAQCCFAAALHSKEWLLESFSRPYPYAGVILQNPLAQVRQTRYAGDLYLADLPVMTTPELIQNHDGMPFDERRRICTDRRQARGVWNQASEDRRKNRHDRRSVAALAHAMAELSSLEAECATAESDWARADTAWARALAEYEIAEADWSEARAARSKARAAVAKAKARVEGLKRSKS